MANSKEMKAAIDKVFEDINQMSDEELKKELETYKKGYWFDIILNVLEERKKLERA